MKEYINNLTKKIVITVLSICLLYNLYGCGNDNMLERTEDQISNDIQKEDDYINTYNLEIDSISISKRQTNIEDKNDYIWCDIDASNDKFSYSAKYEITYILYNDGWDLETFNKENSSIVPKNPPTQTQEDAMSLVMKYAEQDMTKEVDNFQIEKKSKLKKISELSYAYYFQITATNKSGYEMIPANYAVFYQFDPNEGWNSEISHVSNISWK